MAVITGLGGSITGVSYNADVTQWSISVTAESVDTTNMNPASSFRTVIAGVKSWSGSYTALVDASTVASINSDLGGANVTATFLLSGGANLEGDICITDIAVSATIDNAVEAVYSFTGSGTLTFANS